MNNVLKTVKILQNNLHLQDSKALIFLYCKNEGFKEALDIFLITYLNIDETGPEILKC